MPGYVEEQERLDTERKEKENAKKRQQMQDAAAELRGRKYLEVLKATGVTRNAFMGFVGGFARVNTIALVVGSLAFLFSARTQFEDEYGNKTGGPWNNPLNEIYGDDMSYGQAIKNAYLWDDFRKGNGGLFQGICGLLSIMIALGVGLSDAVGSIKDKDYLKKVKNIYNQLELLKDYGIDAKKLIQDLEPEAKKLISKMSELDRGYFDNLLAGGLSKSDYETCVAIVSGYLKSHPKEYNNIIAIIDENTLPESIKKKYGKEKTISFGAAQAMMYEDR